MPRPTETDPTELFARSTRARELAERLETELPGQITGPAEARAFAVWWGTVERQWRLYAEGLAMVMGEVEPVDDREALLAARRGDLDETGRRIRQFADFCQAEAWPLLERLERGLDLMERDGPKKTYLSHYAGLRFRVRQLLPVAWSLAAPAAKAYQVLLPEQQREAEARWGPLTGADPNDFSPLWFRHFPVDRLKAIDARAGALDTEHAE
jgi:hypothetical protein